MSILQEAAVSAILQQIAAKEKLPNPEYSIDHGADKGDGYLSTMTLVKIKTKSSSNEVNVIVKCAHRNPEQRNAFPLHEHYLRETRFYEKVMPAFIDFQLKRNVKEPFLAIPKYYGSCTEDSKEFIIMENIKKLGFELWDRMLPLDNDHITKVLLTYAKFHAVSFAMQLQDKMLYNKLSIGLDNLFVPKYVDRGFFESIEMAMDKAIKLFAETGSDAKYRQRLQAFRNGDKVMEFFHLIEQTTWEHAVISHGDSWLNNFMFKYTHKNNKKCLQEIKFIDFQMLRNVSPTLDLAYAIFVNTDELIYNNCEHYLKLYYDHVISQGKEMGTDISKFFTYSEFKQEWAKYSPLGLLMGLVGINVIIQDKTQVLDLSDLATGQTSVANVFFVDNNLPEARRRTKNLVMHFVDNNFI